MRASEAKEPLSEGLEGQNQTSLPQNIVGSERVQGSPEKGISDWVDKPQEGGCQGRLTRAGSSACELKNLIGGSSEIRNLIGGKE